MPAYYVPLPVTTGQTLTNGQNAFVVFAENAADAGDIVSDYIPLSGQAVGQAATPVAIAAADSLSGFSLNVTIQDTLTTPLVTTVTAAGQRMVKSVAIAGGGTGYVQGNTLTVVHGAAGVGTAATITVSTVDGSGVITAAVIATYGRYTASPSNLTTNLVTGGAGTGATFALTMIQDTIETLGLLMQDALNATSPISNAVFTLSTNVLTVAAGGSDALGDKHMTVELRGPNQGYPIAGFVSSIVHGGVSSADLTVTLGAETRILPKVLAALKVV